MVLVILGLARLLLSATCEGPSITDLRSRSEIRFQAYLHESRT